ncbi:molybdopterin synthase sulfur carrier subunit [Luteibacter sp. 621]|uniref:MoaD/ThiS family protein n=1 Tax=Luteibacter sp. 621 TaxID=3373916 RepID=UPI003D201A9A
MIPITFELYANLERLAGTREYGMTAPAGVRTVGEALALLATARPELAGSLERCACVSGDTIVRRADPLPADGRIALLPPVAGG